MEKIKDIVLQIADLQSKSSDKYFPKGCFASYRSNYLWFYKRPDANIFSTAITIFTLNQIKNKCDIFTQKLISDITLNAQNAYHLFENKQGFETYNFFQTKPSKHFTNGFVLKYLDFLQLPDDIDDTAMVYLTSIPDKIQLEKLQERLKFHANTSQKTIVNTFEEYKELPAYSTWFGNKMYNEFDACAMSNILYCLAYYNLSFDKHAISTLLYLESVILTNQYIIQPFNVAHHYASTPVIMYHLARLFADFDRLDSVKVKCKLSDDIALFLDKKTVKGMDRLILETSYLRLNPNLQLSNDEQVLALYAPDWNFFIGGFLTAFENQFIYKLSSCSIFHMKWSCEAHCLALLAERLSFQH
ncbi:MAG: hypothetical protein KA313_00210 [Pseudarcicella sp.]|nr:hypothetical protein [Pseudarcicella sp.]MBP6409501.1 hypothetical protein [Pseudarcicella sp.]